jgi:cytochrome b6-f complex iron-sulfur subunit
VKRREVLELLLAIPLLAGCGAVRHATASEEGNSLIIDAAEFQERESVVVRTKRYQFPIYVFQHSATEYSAVLAECTHNGCEVQPEGSVLACPCHGSEFARNGSVLQGPAARALKQFSVTVGQGQLRIHLS